MSYTQGTTITVSQSVSRNDNGAGLKLSLYYRVRNVACLPDAMIQNKTPQLSHKFGTDAATTFYKGMAGVGWTQYSTSVFSKDMETTFVLSASADGQCNFDVDFDQIVIAKYTVSTTEVA